MRERVSEKRERTLLCLKKESVAGFAHVSSYKQQSKEEEEEEEEDGDA